ncbi:MAG: LLM class flavin-dependent oxidoreductase [Candidatus Hodarchaeota archaeon]
MHGNKDVSRSFGLQLEPQFGFTKTDVDKLARQLGQSSHFDMVWISDHMFLDENAVDKSAFDCWTLMSYLAAKYVKLRIGALVLCNSYRYPSILAKMITTLDHLSEGRIEIGYGSGWKEIEYKAYGIDFPPVKTRLEQLVEGLEVLLELWSDKGKGTYTGNHYALDNALCFPKPFQQPHPRLWIGSMTGGKKMLRIAAKYGDGINLAWAFSPEQCKMIFKQLDKYSDEVQRKQLLRSVGFWVRLFENEEDKIIKMKEMAKQRGFSLEEYQKRTEGALLGTQKEIMEKLTKYLKIGVSHFIFMFPGEKESRYIQIFDQEILPSI